MCELGAFRGTEALEVFSNQLKKAQNIAVTEKASSLTTTLKIIAQICYIGMALVCNE